MKTLDVAVVQNSAGPNEEENLSGLEKLLADAAGADLVALPEVVTGRGDAGYYRAAAQPLEGRVCERLAESARKLGAWLLAGSLIERDGEHVYNTSVLFDRGGSIAGKYRKIHLFEARLEDGARIREADSYEPGREPALADLEGWKSGFAICYDLRFPELFRYYAAHDAALLLAPSNFTQRTGKDHWEVLIRARAIENQCFVVAPNQCGRNPATGVKSHGHSMVVGPWGEVLCRAGTEQTVVRARLDPGVLASVRARVPALKHRVIFSP